MQSINRRQFLKQGVAALAWLALPSPLAGLDRSASAPAPLGRITTWNRQAVRSEPLPTADWMAWKTRDELLPLYATVEGEGPWPSNPVWYRTHLGYIHSAFVQPVRNEPVSEVVYQVVDPGFWGRVCVPFAEARWQPGGASLARRFYYGSVYRVVGVTEDADGAWWYQVKEGFAFRPSLYVPSQSIRQILSEELTPISISEAEKLAQAGSRGSSTSFSRPYKPVEIDEELESSLEVRPEKWIEINLQDQALTCFEGERAVFSTRISSGLSGTVTPRGEHHVLVKRHTSRMIGEDYDLPGVTFPVYFTSRGVAIHGTYWHNDFGRPRSHGCVNVTNDAAEWVFRWTDPPVPYSEHTIRAAPGEGTRIVVI